LCLIVPGDQRNEKKEHFEVPRLPCCRNASLCPDFPEKRVKHQQAIQQDRINFNAFSISDAKHSTMIYKKLTQYLSFVLGNPSAQTFENRIFNAVMILVVISGAALLSYDLYLGNFVSQCIDISCIIYSSCCYAYSYKFKNQKNLATTSFIFLYVSISIGWFYNNGIHGSIPYFFSILVCYSGIFFKNPFRHAIPLIIFTVASCTIVEFHRPELVTYYTSKIHRFLDIGTSIILCLIINGISIHIIFKKYDIERTLNKKMLHQAIKDKKIIEKSMNEIQVLRGFLPICSHCKKIRDDKGDWKQLEKYIQDNSEAKFSHSMCPECAVSMYPEYFDKFYFEKHPPSPSIAELPEA